MFRHMIQRKSVSIYVDFVMLNSVHDTKHLPGSSWLFQLTSINSCSSLEVVLEDETVVIVACADELFAALISGASSLFQRPKELITDKCNRCAQHQIRLIPPPSNLQAATKFSPPSHVIATIL